MVRILIKNYMIIFSVALSISTAQEDRPTAAILYFTGDGLTPQQTKSLGDHFSTALDSTGKVRVIAQSKVDNLLERKGLDVSDYTSDTYAISIGADLGVSYVIAGNVIKIEDSTYTIAAKMLTVDAYMEKIEERITYSGTLYGLYEQTEILAWKLFDLEAPHALRMYGGVPGKGLFGIKGLPTWMANVNQYWCGLGLVAIGGGVAIMIGGSDNGSTGTSPIGGPPDFPQAP